MSGGPIRFTLDGRDVEARPGETIWQVAEREGTTIPHLCWRPAPGYRADGNCRACMVEVEGERVLAASCLREPADGMVVKTQSDRAVKARAMVMELLVADQPPQEVAHDTEASFWRWADAQGISSSRFPRAWDDERAPAPDTSHPAMAVNLDACIQCNLCVRACREVQVNDVIGIAYRGPDALIVFDFDDPMGRSTCVACGECVAVCPTGALMPASIVDMATQTGGRVADAEVASVCPYCGVGCQISYKLRDGKIAWVEGRDGPANENRLCVKGRFGFDYVSSPERLTVPLIRKEGAPKGLNVDPANPWTHFRPASWEEALDAAADGLAALRDAHGGRAVAGFGSAKCSNEEAYLFQKLIRTGFGHNNVDHCTRLCHASSVAALMEGIGSGAVTATFNECLKSDVIVVIGANPTENHPVAATYFKQAVKNGAKLIVMDPRGMGLKRFATHMLQFRPGTDVAMLNAIMHAIVEQGLYDTQYLQAHTDGFEALKAHLADYAPEKMAEVCGIDAATLREVARVYGTAERAMIFWGMGVSQHTHGTDNARCLISLALMCGQSGRPGTGLHPLRGQNNVQGASDAGLIPMVLPDYAKVSLAEAREKFGALWGAEIDPQPGLTVVEIVDAIARGDIRGMYVMGENPAMSDPDAAHAREALAGLEHLVVQDIFLTETAMMADVVLPATAWPEKDGTVTNTNRQVQLGRKAVAAPGEAKPDWWITVEIARRLGLDWDYAHPREVFAEMAQGMASLDNITWERLEREGAVTYPSLSPEDPGQAVVFSDRFPTADGRARLVPATGVAPAESPDAEYPMVLTTGRQLEHWHTGAMTRRAGVLDALEPAPTASLHPFALRRLGIAAGDMVRVTTRRGSITLQARADEALQHDMVFIPFAYVEAAANMLTNPQLDPDGKIPEFKYAAARVEKAEAEAAE
ncbi:MAG: formate dehydrogenase subunit alpha [Alphaproteobacteria bacterium]|nr:formate dehydrogenase subunit alpha [Alphaproteobacteria bacterium]MDX5369700.1 formate dehydrogenase subunit alpha [Alphaproteobacteria bacterium]MDX5464335.1 formate dehydrogenase subunit alpha [Alphaproteobacteria bacterium]